MVIDRIEQEQNLKELEAMFARVKEIFAKIPESSLKREILIAHCELAKKSRMMFIFMIGGDNGRVQSFY